MTTPGQVRRWASLYRRGWSYRRIAAEAGVAAATVRRAISGQVEPRPPGPRPKVKPKPPTAEVVRTYLQLKSIRAVERELEVSETYVRARLHEAGLIERHPDQRQRKAQRGRD